MEEAHEFFKPVPLIARKLQTLLDVGLGYDQLAQRFSLAHAEGITFLKSGIATRNAEFNRMIEEIERVAIKSRAPILLMGPNSADAARRRRRAASHN